MIFDIIFRRILARTLGLYTRYYFFKLLGKNKSIDYLSGSQTDGEFYSQDLINALVGAAVFFILIWIIFFVIP